MKEMRLQKYLAEAGIASRRKAEELIRQGAVSVNGAVVTELGTKVDIRDTISVNGRKVNTEEKKVYIMLNKPEGYVTTVKDQFSRPTVLDLVKDIRERIYPVGRLDYDTSGLILLTNDGELTFKLTHPSHEVSKLYIARLRGTPTKEEINLFQNGLNIEDYVTSPAQLNVLEVNDKFSIVKIEIHEGKNRQIRKMCDNIGHPVASLKRVAMGKIKLGDLPEGKWRYLSKEEIDLLK